MVIKLPEQLSFDFYEGKLEDVVQEISNRISQSENVSYSLLNAVDKRRKKEVSKLYDSILDSVKHIG